MSYERLSNTAAQAVIEQSANSQAEHQCELAQLLTSTVRLNALTEEDQRRFGAACERREAPPLTEPAGRAVFACQLLAHAWPQLLHHDASSIQPLPAEEGIVRRWVASRVAGGEPLPVDALHFCVVEQQVKAQPQRMTTTWDEREIQAIAASQGFDARAETLACLARELALELNLHLLTQLLTGAPRSGTQPASSFSRRLQVASDEIFQRRHGDATCLVLGSTAFAKLATDGSLNQSRPGDLKPDLRAGLTLLSGGLSGVWLGKTYKTALLLKEHVSSALLLRRGEPILAPHEQGPVSDAAHLWAPFALRVEEATGLPDEFKKRIVVTLLAHEEVDPDLCRVVSLAG